MNQKKVERKFDLENNKFYLKMIKLNEKTVLFTIVVIFKNL